jgi:hypothetical protein
MTALLQTLAAKETAQPPAMERFIETLTALSVGQVDFLACEFT